MTRKHGDAAEQYPRRLRVLTLLEAATVAGAVKPFLEFAREALHIAEPRIELILAVYVRRTDDNELIHAIRRQGLCLELIRERRASDFDIILQLRALVKRHKPDIIWTHNSKSNFLVCLTLLNLHSKWVAVFHAYARDALRTRLYNQLDRWSWRGADRLVADCKALAKQCVSRGIDRSKISIRCTPIRRSDNPPSYDKRALREQLGIDAQSIIVLAVGRLSKEKGHADLVRAISILKHRDPYTHVKLLVVGDGPEATTLRTLTKHQALARDVTFVGHQRDAVPYYALADILAIPSHSEGVPNVLLEGISARLPVVATNVGGIPEAVTNEVNALMVPSKSPAALATAIQRLVDDFALRAPLVASSRSVLEKFSIEDYFRNVAGIF